MARIPPGFIVFDIVWTICVAGVLIMWIDDYRNKLPDIDNEVDNRNEKYHKLVDRVQRVPGNLRHDCHHVRDKDCCRIVLGFLDSSVPNIIRNNVTYVI